jgi:hypothetical protein
MLRLVFRYLSFHFRSDLLPHYEPVPLGASIGYVQTNSLIILGAWTLWKHRNRCVFDGIAPILVVAVSQVDGERRFCELAGARGIFHLIAQLLEA